MTGDRASLRAFTHRLRHGYVGSAERGHAIRWSWFPHYRQFGVYIWRFHAEWTLPHVVPHPDKPWREWTAGSFRIVLFDGLIDE